MQKSELISFILHPDELNRDTLDGILRLKGQFPFFQTARLLAVKNRFLSGDEGYRAEIEEAAAFVTDRRVLYDLIYPLTDAVAEQSPGPDQTMKEPSIPDSPPTLRDNINDLLSMQLHELELVDPDEAGLEPEVVFDVDTQYSEEESQELLTLDPGDNAPPTADVTPDADSRKLIDKFIEANPRMEPRQDDHPQIDISEDSVKENDGIFTDTLAKIYVRQGLYSKAIFAYEKLILKYPEKSDYFADQIEEIKKLTNNQ
jgi:hypothetical protein